MASIFPDITVNATVNNDIDYGKEISLELLNGEPKVYDGIEALKIWIEKAIKTVRYRWPCYTWDYGTEIEELIGRELTNDLQAIEIPRLIRETLIIDSRIKEVSNFVINREKEQLNIEFDIYTYLGDTITQGVIV